MASQGRAGFDFDAFQNRLGVENLNDTQKDLLEARLDLLKDFVRPPRGPTNANTSSKKPDFEKTKQGKADERKWENEEHAKRQAAIGKKGTWSFKPGSLTIVVSGPYLSTRPSRLFSEHGKSESSFTWESGRTMLSYEKGL